MSRSEEIILLTFPTEEQADELVELLVDNEITARVSKDEDNVAIAMQVNIAPNKFQVIIDRHHLENAKSVLKKVALEQLKDIPSDYYLYEFTNDELLQVLIERNEWSETDVLLSQKILDDRGVQFKAKEIEDKYLMRQLELAEPEGGQVGWILIGYISAILGGLLGMIIGSFIWRATNRMPDGTKVPAYTDEVRQHGRVIFIIATIVFSSVILLNVIFFLQNAIS